MPWFYFHLRTPQGLEPDDTGLELAGIEAAYLEACASIPEISADFACEGKNPARYSFEIADPAGRLLMEVPFTEILDRGCRPGASPSPDRSWKGWLRWSAPRA